MQRMALVRGTLDVLVLRALNWGPMHGFEITTWLEERSGGKLGVEDGALYHALVAARGARLDRRRVGRDRERTARALLQAHTPPAEPISRPKRRSGSSMRRRSPAS